MYKIFKFHFCLSNCTHGGTVIQGLILLRQCFLKWSNSGYTFLSKSLKIQGCTGTYPILDDICGTCFSFFCFSSHVAGRQRLKYQQRMLLRYGLILTPLLIFHTSFKASPSSVTVRRPLPNHFQAVYCLLTCAKVTAKVRDTKGSPPQGIISVNCLTCFINSKKWISPHSYKPPCARVQRIGHVRLLRTRHTGFESRRR